MKKKLRKKLWTVALFLLKFNLLAIPMYLVLWWNLSYPALQNFLTVLTYKTLVFLGYDASLVKTQTSIVPLISFSEELPKIGISWDSTGWKSLYALTALTIATPFTTLKKKGKFLAVALPFLFLLNFFRILTTILIAVNYGFQYFDVVHTLLWREGLIFAVVAIWGLWLREIKYKVKKQSDF
ncbi:MAG: archaeosortase/exosortase family protein [Candidatus Heimdallarchaeota archaeon]